MKVFIVYCHPCENSFTNEVFHNFVAGLNVAGHECIVSDLYKMNFITDISEEEYLRETHYKAEQLLPEDVLLEQKKKRW